ncbi:hypothetical protein Poli38472_004947 [Pythium oligandrum]|uniref:Uncharacterized protein n=1 Tax=Pythium oligandrum TaxID=41045 RepID=A0A8K1FIL6_PYTOL|nr:hypothetical protein Poli38472_004947 [Pythium oligandrum]|eukprot:TMW59878.1 hypothetical protein Poli38472_004947 [Pythium oligandrum]
MMTERAATHGAMSMGPRAPVKNLSRERMQAELRNLRTLAVELERERNELMERARAPDTNKGVNALVEACRGIVNSEYERRKQAEELNARLREKLDEHIAVIERLKELIDQRSRIDGGGSTDGEKSQDSRHLRFENGLIREFLNDVHVGYRMTDSIVDTVDWDGESHHRSWRVDTRMGRCNGRPQRVLEIQKQFKDPVSSFVHGEGDLKSWRYLAQYFQSSPFSVDELIIQEDMMAIRYRRVYSYRGRDIRVSISWVIERFVEANREVRVWRIKVVGLGGVDGENAMIDKTAPFVDVVGWLVVQPAEQGVVTRICAHLVPGFLCSEDAETAQDESSPHLGDLVSYVLQSLQMDISRANDQLAKK